MLFGRLVYLQAAKQVEGVDLEEYAQNQRLVSETLDAKRGTIYDRNSLPLAQDVQSYTLYAIVRETFPGSVKDKEKVAKELAPILGVEQSYLYNQLDVSSTEEDPGPFQVEFGTAGSKLSYEVMEEIEALDLEGVYFRRENKRFYPNGAFASHVLGYTHENEEGDIVGAMGLEQALNDQLAATPGQMKYGRDKHNVRIDDVESSITPPDNGDFVYLTLDQKIQGFLEDAMNRVHEEYTPENMIGIVANPKTGEILAMANYPTFDPNTRDITNYQNDAISYRFEPGSTMKVFTLAAAIEEGVFDPNAYFQSGRYSFNGSSSISDVRTHWGTITYLEGIQRSSNVVVGILGMEKLGPELFLEYLKSFGLDQPTGIDLPNEASGRLLYNYPIEQLTTTFGQGSAITPIQQVQGMTAIANGGKMMKPYIIKEIRDSDTDEVTYQSEPEVAGTPISADTAKQVTEILGTVVSSSVGTGRAYEMEGYDIAGKTGTAQIAGEDGRYMTGHNNYIFSFLGAVPEKDPELVFYVGIKQPKLGLNQYGYPENGSQPVAKVVKPLVHNSMQYLDIAPKAAQEKIAASQTGNTVPDLNGMDSAQAQQVLAESGLTPVIIGEGAVQEQRPLPQQKVLSGSRVFVLAGDSYTMPDLTGYSYREFMILAELLGVEPNTMGSGYVTTQSIQPGHTVVQGDYVVVELAEPNPEKDEASLEETAKDGAGESEEADPSATDANGTEETLPPSEEETS
ncbi:penicillin-binding protein [Bacillaceae bacterium SIJ1]|uniref:penicillin-binding protein n=1 Tax=Litoribacterium kuwaitense TaxID=1398745 RepID=UPI0013E9C27A|nr:penicillin-binding protein [Litoribacterium kuwaitense]NGP44348.1 penicillin-binding protein [Litoribacterium kuwaitense]